MAYDKQKAHEYYEKYTKKGLKKGRDTSKKKTSKKKSSKKKSTAKAKTVGLVGLSNSGLNERGQMQAAILKESIKGEMNAALATAKTPEERTAIIQQYQNKAFDEIQKLKADPATAQPKAEKKTSSKSSSSKSSGSSSSSKSSSSSSSSSSKSSSSSSSDTSTKASSNASSEETKATQKAAAIQTATKMAQDQVNELMEKVNKMTPQEKAEAKSKIEDVMNQIQQIMSAYTATTSAIKEIYG